MDGMITNTENQEKGREVTVDLFLQRGKLLYCYSLYYQKLISYEKVMLILVKTTQNRFRSKNKDKIKPNQKSTLYIFNS